MSRILMHRVSALLPLAALVFLAQCGGGGIVEQPSVDSVTIVQGASVTLDIGAKMTLAATVIVHGGASQAVTWTTSDATKVSVNPTSGEITGVAPGTAVITATSVASSARTATIAVTVNPPKVASVELRPFVPGTGFQLGVTGRLQMTAVPRDAQGNALTGRTVSWNSTNTAVLVAGGTGEVVGVSAGTSALTATVEGVASVPANFNVVATGDPCNVRAYGIGNTVSGQYAATDACRLHTYSVSVNTQTFLAVKLSTLDGPTSLTPVYGRTNVSLTATAGADVVWNVLMAPGTWITALTGPGIGTTSRYTLSETAGATTTCGTSFTFATPGVSNASFNLLPSCSELRIYTTVAPGQTLRARASSTAFNPLVEVHVVATGATVATSANDPAGANAVATYPVDANGFTGIIYIKSRTAGGSGTFTFSIDP